MKTIAEIKAEFAVADMHSYPALYEMYKEDTRSGVKESKFRLPIQVTEMELRLFRCM